MMENKAKHNIIFVTISMTAGGTERVISVLANEASRLNRRVIIMLIGDDRVEYSLDDNIDVICVSKATGGNLIGRMKRIFAMRKEIKSSDGADVISMGSSASIFTLISTIGLKNKVVVSERNDPGRLNHKPISKTMSLVRNILYGHAHRVVLQTEDSKEYFSNKVIKKSLVIMNPLPDRIFELEISGEREKTVISSGRLTVYKGFDNLIDAFAIFNKVHPDYSLKIFGKGELQEKLQKQIDYLGLSDKAILCGFSDDIYEELTKGGMYVSSSISEGVSNALMEALTLGIPVIATDCPVGGSRMCIKDGDNGILVKVGDVEAMADSMCRIAEDREFSNRIAEQAVVRGKDWCVSKIWQQWEALFTDQ